MSNVYSITLENNNNSYGLKCLLFTYKLNAWRPALGELKNVNIFQFG